MENLSHANADSTAKELLLKKLIVQNGNDIVANHRWLWEKDRWNELVFSIVAKGGGLPEADVRIMIDQMDMLGFTSLSGLAQLAVDSENSGQHALSSRIAEFFDESGINATDRNKTLTALIQAAAYFKSKYNGKVQALFRQFGEDLVRELGQGINFTTLSPADANYVLVYWLQNVLGLPLSLRDESVVEFAAEHSLSVEEFIQTADCMGINLAFLDDLVNYRRKTKIAIKEASNNGDTE